MNFTLYYSDLSRFVECVRSISRVLQNPRIIARNKTLILEYDLDGFDAILIDRIAKALEKISPICNVSVVGSIIYVKFKTI